jgi:hypothetical protein
MMGHSMPIQQIVGARKIQIWLKVGPNHGPYQNGP